LRIIFPVGDFARMNAEFSVQEKAGCEGYAIALCGTRAGAGKRSAVCMVRSLYIPGTGDIIDRSSVSVTPTADFMEAVLARAMERRSSVLEIHTHPGSSSPSFSSVDVDHGLDNGRFLMSCRTGFGMLVIGTEGFSIMEYQGEDDSLRPPESATVSIMTRAGLSDLFSSAERPAPEALSPATERQNHIWGDECQRKINAITAGIAGLGGTGSVLLQMLVRVGVKKFVLCDPDIIEPSNLSRMPYAFEGDAGRKKVRAASGYVKKVAKDAVVKTIAGRVQDARESFAACDVMFGCADNDGARLTMNEIALKYFIPYIDTGTEIFAENGKVREMGGRCESSSRESPGALNARRPSTTYRPPSTRCLRMKSPRRNRKGTSEELTFLRLLRSSR